MELNARRLQTPTRPHSSAFVPGLIPRFTSGSSRAFSGPVMDKFWSIFAMPIGVALCFGPAVIVWWLTKDKEPRDPKPEGKP